MGEHRVRSNDDTADWQAIVTGLSEGVILIDHEGQLTFANQAALTMHGARDLDDLGASVAAYRARYALHDHRHHPIDIENDPMTRIVAGEQFADVVVRIDDRRTARPEQIFRIRSLTGRRTPTNQGSAGLLITDATDLFEAEQRFERTFRANPAPAVICRLSDLRFIRVNSGFLDLTGYKDKEVIGRSVYEIDVLRDAEHRGAAIDQLNAGKTIPQMEACLQVPSASDKWVIVAGHPIEMPGAVPCMLFTFADLEARRKAESALRQSEERFAKAFQLTPIPTIIGKLRSFAVAGLNDAFTHTFGHHLHEILGKPPGAIGLWVDAKQQSRFERELKRAGSVRGFDGCLRTKDGVELDCLISAEIVTIDDDACVLWTLQDITERRRSEKDLIAAIEAAMSDATWFTRGVLDKLAALREPVRTTAVGAGGFEDLTRREREVLKRVGRGATDADIAAELKLSPHTVRNHVASLYRKLGVKRRSAVVVWARERGLVDGPEPQRTIRHIKSVRKNR